MSASLSRKNIKTYLFLLFFAGIIIKIAAAYFLGNKFHPRLWEYHDIAVNIVNGKGFLYLWPDLEPIQRFNIQFRSIQEPLFPILCAIVYFFSAQNTIAVLFLQIIYASAIPLVLFFAVKMIYGLETAYLAGVLALFTPGIAYYSAVNLHQMPLYALFFCLILLFTLKLYSDFSLQNQILFGFTAGLGILTRSTVLLIVFAVFFWLYIYLKKNAREKAFACMGILLVIMAVISPWVIRNYLVHKRPLLLQSSDGYFLYIATNPNANATLYLPDGRFQLQGLPDEIFKNRDSLTEMEFRDVMLEEGLKYAKHDPLRAMRLAGLRAFYFWWFSPITGRSPGKLYPRAFLNTYQFYYAGVLIIFLIQLFIMFKSRLKKKNPVFPQEFLVLLIIFAVSLPHIMFYPEGRHKFSLEPLFLIFVSRRLFLWFQAFKTYRH